MGSLPCCWCQVSTEFPQTTRVVIQEGPAPEESAHSQQAIPPWTCGVPVEFRSVGLEHPLGQGWNAHGSHHAVRALPSVPSVWWCGRSDVLIAHSLLAPRAVEVLLRYHRHGNLHMCLSIILVARRSCTKLWSETVLLPPELEVVCFLYSFIIVLLQSTGSLKRKCFSVVGDAVEVRWCPHQL